MKIPLFHDLIGQASAKIVWLMLNRILAWALICVPLCQSALDTPFWRCLWIDLAILLAHAGLSLALFGKPERKSRTFSVSMHVFGFSPWDLNGRSEFLMTGYRLVLVFVGAGVIAPLIVVLAYRFAQVDLLFGPRLLWVLTVCSVPMFFTVMFVLLHIRAAAQQACRRWGMRACADDTP